MYRVRRLFFREKFPSSLFLFSHSRATIWIQFKFSIHLRLEHLSSAKAFQNPIFPCVLYHQEAFKTQKTSEDLIHWFTIPFFCAFWANQWCNTGKYILNPWPLTFILSSNIPQKSNIEKGQKRDLCRLDIGRNTGTAPVLKWPLQIAQSLQLMVNSIEYRLHNYFASLKTMPYMKESNHSEWQWSEF